MEGRWECRNITLSASPTDTRHLPLLLLSTSQGCNCAKCHNPEQTQSVLTLGWGCLLTHLFLLQLLGFIILSCCCNSSIITENSTDTQLWEAVGD